MWRIGLFLLFAASAIATATSAGAVDIFGPDQVADEGGEALNCTIKPLRVVEVSSPMRGIAAKVLVSPGEVVKTGDPLVQLDADMTEADMRLSAARAEADAALKAAIVKRDGLERKKARLEEAVAAQAVSLAEYEAAALDLDMAKAAVESEQQQLRLAELDHAKAVLAVEKSLIRSPVAGVIGEDLIDPGESVERAALATIYVNKPLRVEVFVPAPRLRRLLERSSFSIYVDDTAGNAIPVSLDYVSQAVDLASNTVSVFFTLTETGIRPGSPCMFNDINTPAAESHRRVPGNRRGSLLTSARGNVFAIKKDLTR
ncbi:HlyD family efflux transporter periplasmic adaptor subunit [Rhodobacterales bacterium]|nr:HlyD family efflux transporter periplasmic adaptor subunit [Rhodobacterales bacterium]